MNRLLLLALLGCSEPPGHSSACEYTPGCMERILQEDIEDCEAQNKVWVGGEESWYHDRCRAKSRRELCEDDGRTWTAEAYSAVRYNPVTELTEVSIETEYVCR